MLRLFRKPFLALLLFALPLAAFAQTFRGTLSGAVTDAQGAVIADATVQLTNPTTGLVQNATSSKAGEFNFPELPVGIYQLAVSASGFEGKKVQDINVAVSKVTNLRIELSVGTASTVVDVVANGVQTDTTSSALVAVIDSKTVQDVPMNGRDFTQMVKLSPGVNVNKSVNGARTNGINYQIDGADNNDPWSNAVASNQGGVAGIAGGLVPIEAIDQFAMQNNAEADMGRNGGANANMVLKSGTNQIHGDVFYFDRNEYFAALSPVALPGTRKPEIRNHQFGFTLGGPIFKDRTFLFLAGEAQLANANNSVGDTVLSDAWIASAKSYLNLYNLTPNSVAINLYGGLYPSESKGGAATSSNYLSNGKNTYNSFNGVIKLDHRFNDKYSISARYLGTTGTQTADVGSHYAEYFQKAPMHIHNFSVVQNSILTSHLINQVTFATSYFLQTFNDADQNYNPLALGLNLGLSGNLATGSPQITVSGFDVVGETAPLGRTDVTGHVTDTLHWNIGRHSLKIGGEFRHSNVNVGYYTNGRGAFTFDGTRGPWAPTAAAATATTNCAALGFNGSSNGNTCSALKSVADFLLGEPTNSSGAVILRNNPQRVYLVSSFDAWVHDDYQITPHLSLNAGIRYTYPGVVHDEHNDLYNFVPGQGFQPSPLYNKDLKDVAPRVGFAYSLDNENRTVLRGAYGFFYDTPTIGQFVYNNIGNTGATGIYSNPAGAAPVYQITATNVTFQSGVPVFANAGAATLGGFGINPNFKTAYIQNFNLNIEQQLSKSTLFTLAYVGSQGRRLGLVYDINQPVNGVRPFAASYPNLAAINQVNSGGTSHFNSLQASIHQSVWHGISTNFYYTWGKAMDYTSTVTTPESSYNLKADYGPSTFDVRNSVTGFVSYEVPQLAHVFPRLTKGWQLNSLATFAGGSPINILDGTNVSLTSENKDRPNAVAGVNPIVGRTNLTTSSSSAQTFRYLTSAAYSVPTTGYGNYGNVLRDNVYGPGLGSVDFSVFKHTPITEKINTEFRVEIYNIANQANFANPTAKLSSSSFGLLTQTRNGSSAPGLGFGEPRNAQLALKVSF